MNVWARSIALALLAAVALASLAFTGVRFAEKPVRWMPVALMAYGAAMFVGLVWALWPVFAAPRIMRLSVYLRLPFYALSVLILFSVFACLSYGALFWFWFAFGGQL